MLEETSLKYYSEDDFAALFLEIHDKSDGEIIDYTTVVDRLHLHDIGDLETNGPDRSRLLEIINNVKKRINHFAKNDRGSSILRAAREYNKLIPFQLQVNARSISWKKVANPSMAKSVMLTCKQQVSGSLGRTSDHLAYIATASPPRKTNWPASACWLAILVAGMCSFQIRV